MSRVSSLACGLMLLVSLLVFPLFSSGQRMVIEGRALDAASGAPLPYATIILRDGESRQIMATVAQDSTGMYRFENVPGDRLSTLTASYVGYKPFVLDRSALGFEYHVRIDLRLEPLAQTVATVRIEGGGRVQARVGKVVYAVDDAMLSQSSSMTDLLDKVPELQVNPMNGQVGVKGYGKVLLLVNGMHTGREMDIRSVSQRDVERIEVITTPSAGVEEEYDAVINLVLRAKPERGMTSFFDATSNLAGRYLDGVAGALYGGAKLRADINYRTSLRRYAWHLEKVRRNVEEGRELRMLGSSQSPLEHTHHLDLRMDWIATPRDFFNLTLSNLYNATDRLSTYQYDEHLNGKPLPRPDLARHEVSGFYAGNYSLYYRRHLAGEDHKLSVNTNAHLMRGELGNRYSYKGAAAYSIVEAGAKYSGNVKVEYAGRLHDAIQVTVGGQGYYQDAEGALSSGGRSKLRNWRVNAYTDFAWSVLPRLDLQAGVRVERNQLMYGDNSLRVSPQDVIVPYATLGWSINPAHRLDLRYRRRPHYPSVWNYSAYVRMADSLTRYVGNPALKAFNRDQVELGYTYRWREGWMRIQGYYTAYSDAIYTHAGYGSDGVLVHRYANGASVLASGVTASGSIELFGGGLSIEPSISGYYEQHGLQGKVREGWTYDGSTSVSIALPWNLGLGSIVSYSGRKLTYLGYEEGSLMLDAAYVQYRMEKVGARIYLGVMNVGEYVDDSYEVLGPYESTSSWRSDNFGIAFRLVWSMFRGKQYRIEDVERNGETDIIQAL